MKTLPLIIDDTIYEEAAELSATLNTDINTYLNEAIHLFNLYSKRRILKIELTKESEVALKDSMEILHEFEEFIEEIFI